MLLKEAEKLLLLRKKRIGNKRSSTMPKIIWEGNKKDFGTYHDCDPMPENAVKLREAEGFIGKAVPYGIVPMMICMLVVFLKAFINREPPIDPVFLVPAFLAGFIVAMPLHELMHAVCYPRGATVWVGLCMRKLAAYAISYHPLGKGRFIIMSLAPSLLGIIPLTIFIFTPITLKPILTICIICSFMGLISPAPDYMDVVTVIRKAPRKAMIQDSSKGLYYYPDK